MSYFTLATFSGRAAATRPREGPMVRIRLPPAEQRRVHVSGDFVFPRREAGFSRGCAGLAGAARLKAGRMAAILSPRVVRRIAGECTDVDERGAVGIRFEPAAAIDENQNGIRGSNLLCSTFRRTTSKPLSLLSMAKLNIARSHILPSICSMLRIDQTCLGRSGGCALSVCPYSRVRGAMPEGSDLQGLAWSCSSVAEDDQLATTALRSIRSHLAQSASDSAVQGAAATSVMPGLLNLTVTEHRR